MKNVLSIIKMCLKYSAIAIAVIKGIQTVYDELENDKNFKDEV